MDFAILERKLAILEHGQRAKANEINTELKNLYECTKDESQWNKEKEQLVGIIKQKNREIKGFRQELDNLLKTLSSLKGSSNKNTN